MVQPVEVAVQPREDPAGAVRPAAGGLEVANDMIEREQTLMTDAELPTGSCDA